MTKRIKVFYTILSLIALLILFTGCDVPHGSDIGAKYENEEKYTIGEGSLSCDLKNLYINWITGDIKVEYYEGQEVQFIEKANMELAEEQKMRYLLEGNTLRLQYAKSGFVNNINLNKDLIVYIPSNVVLTELNVNTVSGDVTVNKLKAKDINIDSVSGYLFLEELDVSNEIDLDTVSGRTKLSVLSSVNSIDIDTVSGNIDLSCADVDDLSIDSTSGSIKITLDKAKKLDIDSISGETDLYISESLGFTLNFSTVSGDVSCSLPSTIENDKYVYGDGSLDIDIDSTSGDVFIQKK